MTQATDVWRCRVVAPPADWPVLHVLAVVHPCTAPGGTGAAAATEREAARRRVRELLQQHAGPAVAAPVLDAAGRACGGGRVSFSHEPGYSLLAWCEHGRIGIDAVGPRGLAGASTKELAQVACLYLGADPARRADRPPSAGTGRCHRDRFLYARAWARHEARLKCLGLDLAETSATLQALLADCRAARVALPAALSGTAGRPAAWLAWRADSETALVRSLPSAFPP